MLSHALGGLRTRAIAAKELDEMRVQQQLAVVGYRTGAAISCSFVNADVVQARASVCS